MGESSSAEGSGGGSEDSTDSQVSGSQSDSMTSVDPTDDGTTGESESGMPQPTATSPMTMTGPDTDDPSTTSHGEPSTCEIFMVVNQAAVGKMEPNDCGYVQLADPLAAWEAAQTCVLDNYNGELAFTLVAEQQGIDSEVRIGFAGSQGEVYAASRFLEDSNGLVPGTLITGGPCNISPIVDCAVTQGNLCLDCVDSPNPMTICEEP